MELSNWSVVLVTSCSEPDLLRLAVAREEFSIRFVLDVFLSKPSVADFTEAVDSPDELETARWESRLALLDSFSKVALDGCTKLAVLDSVREMADETALTLAMFGSMRLEEAGWKPALPSEVDWRPWLAEPLEKDGSISVLPTEAPETETSSRSALSLERPV